MGRKKADISPEPLVIVGNGMVSWRLCQQLVQRGVHRERPIIVFGEEPRPAYDRVNLTELFKLEGPEALLLSGAGWYTKNRIRLITGRRVVRIDREAKVLIDDQGERTPYGDCVLATGSKPFVQDIAGADSPNVFVYRTVEDVEAIKAAAKPGKRAVIIGGGLLGLEAADALRDLDMEPTLVQSSNALMSRQLNVDGASLLLREVASMGMSVRLKTQTKSIEPKDGQLHVRFSEGQPIDAELVVLATGIRPRDELASEAGLPLAIRGGIMINDHLQTEDPHVYAIGECVSHHGRQYGLVAPGYQMADALAARFAGEGTEYKGSDQSCRLKLLGVEVSVFGEFMEEGTVHVYRGQDCYRSIVLKHEKLIGATVVGPWQHTLLMERAVREGRKLSPGQCEAFARSGNLFDDSEDASVINWPDSALICHCTSTNCGVIRGAVAGGCTSVTAITKATGAGGVCGSCLPQLAEFVGEDAQALAQASSPRGKWLLIIAAILGLIGTLIYFLAPGLPAAESVQGSYYKITKIWQDSITKQITGYTLAGISAIALLLSARKRIRFLAFGNYGFWRAAHSWLGVLTIVGLLFHTGLHLGENLNLWLIICFLGLNLAGALAAIAVAAEKRFDGQMGLRLRRWAMKSHLLFFIPYPVLLGFHIAKVYLY